jgi:hypothetical protein
MVKPFSSIAQKTPQEVNYTIGVTKYLARHRVKLQYNLTYIDKKSLISLAKTGQFYTAFQVELGI